MDVLDRILDGDDHAMLLVVDLIDHCGERTGFTASRWARYKNEPAGFACDFFGNGRQAELAKASDVFIHNTKSGFYCAALLVYVYAKSANILDFNAEVEFPLFFELGFLGVVEQRIDHSRAIGCC